MEVVNIQAAETNLSKLIEQALAGHEVVIGKSGHPMIKLVPYEEPVAAKKPLSKTGRQGGQFTGKIWFAPDYDQADAMIEKMFEESEIFPKE